MTLSEICIKRPVLATMMSLAIILFGVAGILQLPVRELPDIDPPIVTITTIYPGANARIIETEVTERIEDAVSGVEGIEKLTSQSREQLSLVTVQFSLSRNIDVAAQEIRDRVLRIRSNLPDDIDEPVIAKADSDARPIMWVALFSEQRSTLELTDLAENQLQEQLQIVPGVSSVILGGSKRFAIRIRLDSAAMAAREITIIDVEDALENQNVDLPSGQLENREREFSIYTRGDLQTPEEFGRIVVSDAGSPLVRLEDVATVEIGVENEKTVARYNGDPAVGLGVIRQSQANTIEVAKGITATMERLSANLPDDVSWFVAYDESIFVEKAITEVWRTLGITFGLVVLTIFIFLRNIRSTLVPAITIPVSVIGTFFVLYLFGYSINILTMLALVLVIGIVVDDSIVVLENIYRHIEEGMKPIEAAILGMKEITFAVIVTTVTLVAVFLPITFQTSDTGRLFIEFGVTLASAVVVSSFVALTLTPMLSARTQRARKRSLEEEFWFFRFFEKGFDRLARAYEKTLGFSLNHPSVILLIIAGAVGVGAFFYLKLDQEFLVEEDKGRLFALAIAPEGSTSDYTDRMVEKMEQIVKQVPEVAGFFTAVALPLDGVGNPAQGLMFARFVDASERKRSVPDIVNAPGGLKDQFFGGVEGAFSIAILPKSIGSGFGLPYQLVLQSPDLDLLSGLGERIAGRLSAEGFLTNTRSTFNLDKPELRVVPNRDRLNELNVSLADLSRTLQVLFGGEDISNVKRDGKEYDVIAQLDRESRLTPEDISRVYVRTGAGELVPVSNLVDFEEGGGPNAIERYNRIRSTTIEATPTGVTMGEAIRRTEAILEEELPPNVTYTWSGEAEDLIDTGNEILFVLGFALLLVYMVLAAQFESLTNPLTVLLTVPLAACGAFGALWALSFFERIPGMNLNLFSQIGLILLVGLVTKNAILLVEFANQQLARGVSAKQAMLEAGKIRFRPIMMTSVSTIAGLMPIVIGFGAGAESRRPLGVAAAGGLISSLALTLIAVPVVYLLFSKLTRKPRATEPGTNDEKTA
ncbi:MAG: efflux RND transporter permease subunit [Verrucomicrobiota bacterium]